VELQISTPEGSPSGGLLRTTATVPAIKVSGNVQSMMIVKKVPPAYPELAKSARVSGVVHLAAVIAKDGTIQELHSLGGPALLIQAAMDAVRQWVYKPTLLNGEPVAVETTIDVNFTLLQ
jgi:protein TonB